METETPLADTPVADLCRDLVREFPLIPPERREVLRALGDYVSRKHARGETARLVVICTHNSRRSHLGQLWLAVGADYFGLTGIQTFSGGTEATALNDRVVAALGRAGFGVKAEPGRPENPVYLINWRATESPYRAYSKRYTDAPNPRRDFAAILVCARADTDCPLVSGADFRLALPYEDPQVADGTAAESETYDARLRQIGREMLFALSRVGDR